MATIKQVADYADVSVATVSRVINKTGYVSQDLQQRVYRAMEALNYKPSALAQSLRNQRTQVVGVLIPQLDQPFFSTLTYSIEQALFANDYRVLICSAEENREKEDAYIEMMLRQRVDGAIIVPTGHSSDNVRRLLDKNVPVVLVDRDLGDVEGVSRVLTDNYQGGYDGMQHLLQLGHTRIGIISTPLYSEAMAQRVRGTQQAMLDFGLEPDSEMLISGTLQQFEMGYSAARVLLEKTQPPTAIFALTDVMAVGVIHGAAMLGLKLPHDLSVMGFDNIPLAAYIMPELTTVAQPIAEIGEIATQVILRHMLDTEAPVSTTVLKDELVVRNSTMPPKTSRKG
ncbi:MAG: LacI family DNA-binding transcriptional regulator [Chloroflexi bacterium]|nr:LacI family DNA-binding transcriptional regulator [Chloroflexota bacterium]